MNQNRCPQCDLLNLPSAAVCLQCNTPLSIFPKTFSEQKTAEFVQPENSFTQAKTAEYSKTTSNYSNSTPFNTNINSQILPPSKTGSRTYFWYRMLCSVIIVSGIFWASIGGLAIIGSFDETGREASDAFTGGVFFLLSGGIPALLFLLGVLFPPRSWSWIFGILLLVLALLSCIFSPFAIALLIFWMKPETQTFFGRN